MKNSMKEQRVKETKKNKVTSAKKSKFRIFFPFSLLSENIKFLSKQSPLLDVLDWNSKSWVISEFSWKTIAIRSTFSRIAFFD